MTDVRALGPVNSMPLFRTLDSIVGRIVDEADPDCCYAGIPKNLKDATSAAAWLIVRFKKVDGITYIGLADGNHNFDNIFDNRASLDYYPQEP